jgi:hypothetical protein
MADSEYRKQLEAAINSLERVLQILKGDTDTPGVVKELGRVKETLYGSEKDMGVVLRVKIMWLGGVMLIMFIGTTLGFLLKTYLTKLLP